MADTHLDAKVNTEIFRKDHPIILAANRHLASIKSVRMVYASATGYLAGTVIARNTVNGLYYAYNDAGSSGTEVASAILFEEVTPESGDTMLARGIFGGEVFQAKCVGLDANAITDLKARSITDALGTQILKF